MGTTAARPTEHCTRERLLDSAERLFAERGFALSSVREITSAASCNVAAVNYYFGGKGGLYREVFRRCLSSLRERRIATIRLAVECDDREIVLEDVLRSFADAFVEPLVARHRSRSVLRLISREMVDPHLPAEMFRDELAGPVREVMREALARVAPGLGQRDAELCVQSLVAQLVHVLTVRRMGDGPDEAPPSRAWLTEVTEHIVRLTAAGIRAYARGEIA